MKKMISKNWLRLCVGLWLLSLIAQAQTPARDSLGQTDKFLADLLNSRPDLFNAVLSRPDQHDVQILYTQINRDKQNRPSFRTYRYRVDKDRYFYPASTVKLPAVLLALETLHERGIPRDAVMITDSSYSGQSRVRRDTTAKNRLPSVEQYAKKILIVSDNDAYNRLYELIGQCPFNDRLKAKGLLNSRFTHRLSLPLSMQQNAYTNPVYLIKPTYKSTEAGNALKMYAKSVGEADSTLVSFFPGKFCDRTPVPTQAAPILRGKGYMVGSNYYKGDSLVNKPFDFTSKNAFPLEDQHALLRTILFPESVPEPQRFDLSPDDYRFVYQYMSQLPRETRYPNYKTDTSLYDSYCKFLLFGDRKTPMPKSVRIFNKVGDAYGYLIDNAYIVDFDKGVEFMVTAMISCNSDGIFNDDKYDYDTVGFPFMGNLGRLLYEYETTRKKARKPDLSRFRVVYE